MSAASDFDFMILQFMNDDPLTGTYHQYIQGDYDTDTSEYTTVQVDTPVSCIILDFDRMVNGVSSKFGKDVLQGDKDCYMYPVEKADPLATPIVPNPTSDRITIGGIIYKIVVFKEANPEANAPMLYNFMLRR